MTYTFEELSKLDPAEIKKLRAQKADELGEVIQQKYADIAAIMFYQTEIEKVQP
jgi:hypothetical protein